MQTSFDLIIVGGGMVGSALACALRDSSLSIALVDGGDLRPAPVELDPHRFDPRVSALTVSSERFLKHLGVWPSMLARRVSPYRHMQVWDGEGTGRIEFHADEIQHPVLGHIVENSVTQSALLEPLQAADGVRLLPGERLKTLLDDGKQGPRIRLESGLELEARLLVAADGANSQVRAGAGFALREWDYLHHGIVTTVETELPHHRTAWQSFRESGPLAFLPLPDSEDGRHFCSIVWSNVPEEAQRLMELEEGAFCRELERAIEQRLGTVLGCDRRYCLPFRQRHAVDYVMPGIALVGDAAHTIHPLAGQGVNLGLMDAAALAEVILHACARGDDFARLGVLQRYQRQRKGANLAMMGAMEFFERLFHARNMPLRLLRNSGLRWVDGTPQLKQQLVRRAMGLEGDIPRFAR
ncbi:FAD-dependent monooxygenase [Aestuariirhabdus litorea]|uniref:2-octaprenyl-3-methyl-6-methoxy-1,4-benzoquinol hydroxylase n=1 Tax=Aestuariirhabdus litorea TaxID=2528527 RepID=A0A3P3VMW8_9GAMM|nr:FAD-dependent monooxygenase [Aestuariirhabdus litorea]RRJ82996.1 2-octaprenyl-3-methyl-6-methoxy-1,4-benzoquinol hydroxylase [Aestuariirhabdus litorea]RWW93155.1 2-octaprenyl-3-methyl-6-methoxy-1,4-benzoquinol hydroxylase [Endozoicomonadaceae bacterium GTF-13]